MAHRTSGHGRPRTLGGPARLLYYIAIKASFEGESEYIYIYIYIYICTYVYISERSPRGAEFFLRGVTDGQCVFCRMHFGESRASGVGKLGSWGLEVSGS